MMDKKTDPKIVAVLKSPTIRIQNNQDKQVGITMHNDKTQSLSVCRSMTYKIKLGKAGTAICLNLTTVKS